MWPRFVPVTAKIAAKDILQWRQGRRGSIEPTGPWTGQDVAFVWQRHEVFHTGGIELARSLGVPSVLFVPAPQVWEAARWGVRRPGWGRMLERFGECPALRSADLVACGTATVAEEVIRLGVSEDRILITPTGVDLDVFTPGTDPELRHELGLDGRFVVGWVGSFRRFHSIDLAIHAIKQVEGATLLLVGDGPERPRLERLATEQRASVVFAGTTPHAEIPRHLAAMDAALVVLASADASFHYSPLKLAEYLAAGLPVVAPAYGQLQERLTDGTDAMLVPPGDVRSLADALIQLRDDPARRQRLGRGARASAEASWSWDRQIQRIVDALGVT